jgi:hypothetical protein
LDAEALRRKAAEALERAKNERNLVKQLELLRGGSMRRRYRKNLGGIIDVQIAHDGEQLLHENHGLSNWPRPPDARLVSFSMS